MISSVINLNRRWERPWMFHPRELAFCGYSGSGKTTLIQFLLSRWCSGGFEEFSVGYVKHDAHGFTMDHKGKDTDKAWVAGCKQVLISDSYHWAEIKRSDLSLVERRSRLLDNDFVLVEGYKDSPIDKVLVLDEEGKILRAFLAGEFERVVAVVGPAEQRPDEIPYDTPYFQRDNVEAIIQFVQMQLLQDRAPLYGLVLTGGQSRRMGHDKALIKLGSKSQANRALELLSDLTEKAYLSARPGQWQGSDLEDLPQIEDQFIGFGPMGGILSAMEQHPRAAWLVLACDLPFVDEGTLNELKERRNHLRMATAFVSNKGGKHNGLPEPLCTIYEPRSKVRLMEYLAQGFHCPRKVLMYSPIQMIQQPFEWSLDNMNSPDDLNRALQKRADDLSGEKLLLI